MITAGIHLIGTNTHHSFAWLRPSRRLEAQLELDPNSTLPAMSTSTAQLPCHAGCIVLKTLVSIKANWISLLSTHVS